MSFSPSTYAPALTGMNSILAVTGPMSTSVSALALWMKIVCTESFYNGLHDRFQKLIPFDDKTYMSVGKSLGSKGRIGYLKTLGFV